MLLLFVCVFVFDDPKNTIPRPPMRVLALEGQGKHLDTSRSGFNKIKHTFYHYYTTNIYTHACVCFFPV